MVIEASVIFKVPHQCNFKIQPRLRTTGLRKKEKSRVKIREERGKLWTLTTNNFGLALISSPVKHHHSQNLLTFPLMAGCSVHLVKVPVRKHSRVIFSVTNNDLLKVGYVGLVLLFTSISTELLYRAERAVLRKGSHSNPRGAPCWRMCRN